MTSSWSFILQQHITSESILRSRERIKNVFCRKITYQYLDKHYFIMLRIYNLISYPHTGFGEWHDTCNQIWYLTHLPVTELSKLFKLFFYESTEQTNKTKLFLLKMFFWVFPPRQIVVGRRFGTLYRFHLQRLVVAFEDGTDTGFRNVDQLQFDAGEIPKRTFSTQQIISTMFYRGMKSITTCFGLIWPSSGYIQTVSEICKIIKFYIILQISDTLSM